MPTAEQVRNKVLRIMANKFTIKTTDDEEIMLFHESAACLVRVVDWDKEREGRNTLIQVSAPILWNVKRTPALYEWVATEGQTYDIGRIACNNSDKSGETNVEFEHNLLGDNLDEPELTTTVVQLLSQANDLDDELQRKFGGKRAEDL